MIQNIVQYLNLRLETLGRIADLHGISERRKRESDGANVPYCYVGSGEFKPVNIDNGNVGWWRPRGGFSMEPVEVIGRAVRQQRATYPLRFVAILRRELSTSDDAFMPSRLAEDIANALNFDNGDLRGILKAINVEARASGGEFDAATIWPTEFQTSIPDLRYELAMVAVDVTIEVVGRYSCWEGECATDTDILHLFNFCDPSVVARLTPAQIECLQVIAEDANWELYNTEGTLLSTGSIPSGDTDNIVAPDATVLINGNQFDTVASGDAIDVPVVNGGSNPVGSEQSGEWVIGNSTVTINGTQVGDIVAEDSLPIAVELDGNPSGTWNAGTQTWEVTSVPCADATFSIDGTQVDTIASGADLDVSVELNGLPVTPTYNSGTKVIGVTALAGVAVAVTLSDPTPDFGDTITITATPTGFTPTSYQFLLFDGTITLLAQQAGNTLNWTVNVQIGSYDIYVLATDGSSNAYGDTPLDVQGNADALAFIVATGITDATIINAVDSLVVSLKNYGIWAKMKAMYPMVGGTAATHKFNLKNPLDTNAAFRLSFNGGWTHDSNGVTGNGVNTYADTFLIPFSHLIQNNTHLSVYCRNNTQTPIDMASYIGIGSNIFSIGSRQVSNLAYSEHYNGASTSIAVSNTDSRGLVMGSRVNSTTLKLYRNGSQLGSTNTNTSLAAHWNALTAKMFIGNRTDLAATYTNRNYAFITIGDGLDDTEASNLYTAIQAFQTALGRQV